MEFFAKFERRHPDLFAYQAASEVHPHDQLIARTLIRLLPPSVTPNQVTMFRVLATPLVFLLILFDEYAVGTVAFLIIALTDAIDGSMARTQNKITNFGKLFDPLADKLLIGSMVLLLVFQHYSFWLGFAVLGMEIVIILSALTAKVRFKTVRGANIWGKIKMNLQVIAVFLTLAALLWQFPAFFTVAAWLFGLSFGFAVVSLFAHGL